MKKTFTFIAIALFCASSYAQTLQTLWSNASPANYSWNTLLMSRESALYNGKLYVINNSGANSAVYVIDTATGDEIPAERIADAGLTGFGIAVDDAGNLVVPANTAGAANWSLSTINIASGAVKQLAGFNAAGVRVDYLSIFGDIESTTTPAYVIGASTTTPNIIAWEMLNGERTATPAMLFDRGQVAVAANIRRIDNTRFLLTQQSTTPRIMTVDFTATPWVTKIDIIEIPSPTNFGGGVYFELGGTPYLVIPYGANAQFGTVAIFDVTDFSAPVQIGETTAAIGTVANSIFHLSTNVSIISNTEAEIYVWSANTGAAAFKFTVPAPTDWYDNNPDALTFYIGTAQELAYLATLVNGNPTVSFDGRTVELTANINLSVFDNLADGGNGWTPIGTVFANSFSGTFDGKGFTISNLSHRSTAATNTNSMSGLFGYLRGGDNERPGDNCVVKNLNLVNVNIDATGNRVGGLVGWTYGGVVIENVHVQGTIKGNNNVGGIIGGFGSDGARCGAISNSHADVTVIATGNSVGGIAGGLGNGIGTMHNCYVTGTVSGANDVGGLVGAGPAGGPIPCVVSNSAALNTTVKATGANVGRISGFSTGFNFINNVALADMGTDGGTAFPGTFVAEGNNGANITWTELLAGDGTIGGRFVETNGWTVAAGKLPVLFGEPVVIVPPVVVPPVVVDCFVKVYRAQNGNFVINVTETNLQSYAIYAITGRMISSDRVSSNSIEIDTSNLSSGVYLIQVHTAAGSVTKRVIK